MGLSAVGLYGRRTVRLGPLHTSGGGIDVSVGWHAIHLKRFHLILGSAVEALAIYGFGRETASAKASHLLAPAITARLFVEIGLDLGRRLRWCLALGGGYNAVGVILQANGENLSGLSGGYVTLATGLDFSLI
jgi:hypothetical protein